MKTHKSFHCHATLALAALAALTMTACEERYDGSSNEAAKASMEKMCKSLTVDETKEFASSYMIIGLDNLGDDYTLNKMLDGKTVAEINAVAAEIKAKREAEKEKRRIEREQREKEEAERRKAEEEQRRQEKISALTEKISVLRKQEEENQANQAKRDKIIITGASFRMEKDRFINTPKPIISFTINNTSEATISQLSFDAVLTSTGRKVPWVKDGFSYSFKGGLNPGEQQKLDLAPNPFSDWGRVENRDDYQLQLTIDSVYDETEEKIWLIHKNTEKERLECEQELKGLQ